MHRKILAAAGLAVLLVAATAAPVFADTPTPTPTQSAPVTTQLPFTCGVLQLSSQWDVYASPDVLRQTIGKLVVNTVVPCGAAQPSPDGRTYIPVELGGTTGFTPLGTVIQLPASISYSLPARISTPSSAGGILGAVAGGSPILQRWPSGTSDQLATLNDGDSLTVSGATYAGTPSLTGTPQYRAVKTTSGQTGFVLDNWVSLVISGSTAAPKPSGILQKVKSAVTADAAKVKAEAANAATTAKTKLETKTASAANPLSAISMELSLIPATVAGLLTLACAFLAIFRPGPLAVWRRLTRPLAAPASIVLLVVAACQLPPGAPWWSWIGLAVVGLVVGLGVRTAAREVIAKHPGLAAKISGLRSRAQTWAEVQAGQAEPDKTASTPGASPTKEREV
ncbi:MAG: hypothetical protein JWM49_629 [Microbacteriaceae bacterium]|nr:hypothetical protein [Microbacteriaceae bacterium]